MEKQNSFVRFMLLFGIMLIVTQLAMRWLGLVPEPPSIEDVAEQPVEVVEAALVLVGEQEEVMWCQWWIRRWAARPSVTIP